MDFLKNKAFLLVLLAGIGLDYAAWNTWVRFPNALEIQVLDIGQGDAILLTTPEQNHVLIDGGPGKIVLYELADTLPYLFSSLDLVILTHPHQDHIEGLVWALPRFEVGAVLMSAPAYESEIYSRFLKELEEEALPIYFAESGQNFRFGDLNLEVLFPFDPIVGLDMDNVNNASPVIRANWHGTSILLTGDAEAPVEELLLSSGVDLDSDILKAGHHGSKTSSTSEFLAAVSPEIALISAGESNHYGHPSTETLEKLGEMEIQIYRTDLEGRICIILGPQSWIRSIFAPSCLSFLSKDS